MKPFIRNILILGSLTFALFPGMVAAQLNQGGIPRSFSLSMAPAERDLINVKPPLTDILLQEDEQTPLPYRFAVNLPVDLGINAGCWEKAPDGSNIWRLSLKSPGALALTLYFDQFYIPEGGKFFVYNSSRTQWLGAFTSLNNNDLSTFATGLIYGDQITLEYNSPGELQPPLLHVSEVAYAYRGIGEYSSLKTGFGTAGKCMVNVKCSEGFQWYNQKRSITRIAVKKGSSSVWCTGSLVNNTLNDGKPYILTADHCGYNSTALDISRWIFYFDYESSVCPNPPKEPVSKSITGAVLVARSGGSAFSGSDFFMVLLHTAIPDSFNVYYNGWNRDGISSLSGVGIHHPQGDIKKISTYTTPLQPSSYPGNPDQAHWRVNWSATSNGFGTTEGGSSGSPIFDKSGRLVGTLTGGDSSCDSNSLGLPDYYGMFSYHWDQNGTEPGKRLKPWLDPIGSDVVELNGWALTVDEPKIDDLITIYPNPAIDKVNIITSRAGIKNLEIILFDLLGNILHKIDLNSFENQNNQISLSGLTRGMYLIYISDGERRVMRKIIKQ
ncbi:MAG: T9SS type A sorting domain-containing protein [Bacteroidota bacterium]